MNSAWIASLDFAQMVAFGRASQAEHNEIEGEGSRDENRRADVQCTSEDELRHEHGFANDGMANDQRGT